MPEENFYDVDISEGHAIINDFFIDYLFEKIGDNDFLDVGCNSGYLLQKCGRGIGVDLSKDMVRRGIEKGLNISFGDARSLNYGDNSFSIVVLSCVLEQIENYLDAISEALRVSKDKVIGITPLPQHSIWGKVGGTKWVKSVIDPFYLRDVFNASIYYISDSHYYFEIKKSGILDT
jgi:ubiquinone/menaquinone biosynthesis C-methylase UbiE